MHQTDLGWWYLPHMDCTSASCRIPPRTRRYRPRSQRHSLATQGWAYSDCWMASMDSGDFASSIPGQQNASPSSLHLECNFCSVWRTVLEKDYNDYWIYVRFCAGRCGMHGIAQKNNININRVHHELGSGWPISFEIFEPSPLHQVQLQTSQGSCRYAHCFHCCCHCHWCDLALLSWQCWMQTQMHMLESAGDGGIGWW